MDELLKRFLQNANETHNVNIQKENERLEQEKIKTQEKEESMKIKKDETLVYDENLPSIKRIKELGFQINAYHQEEHPYDSEYYGLMDVFYCEYKNWIFTVEWAADPDIDEGILALREPKNVVTGEKLDFYCDLFCNNTNAQRLDNILTVFDIGYQQFIQQKYEKYIKLPQLLKQKGYEVVTKDFEFKIGENDGYIGLGNGVYIRIYDAWRDEMVFVVTNNSKWNINSTNGGLFEKEIGYYFDYNGERDLDELCKCIDAFKEHLKGHIGYKETIVETFPDRASMVYDVYYKGEDFLKIFNKIKNQLKSKYYEKWNHHFLRYDAMNKRYGRYDEESKYENHYTGLEIYETVLFSINDSSQWTIGDNSIQYLIHFEYDRRKNDKECYLNIIQWIGTEYERIHIGVESINKSHPSFKGSYEKYGSFSELTQEIKNFLYENLKIHGVEL